MSTTIHSISKQELAAKVRAGSNDQIVNVLSPENYSLGIIRNSIKIPLSELDTRMSELDKSRPVITYCASSECPASRRAAEKLANAGFDVRAYEGGIKEWTAAGLPVD
jgi:rhodanese-related sulfurtransferase